jgi:hypothetical protein
VAKVPRSEEEAIVALEEGGTPTNGAGSTEPMAVATDMSDALESIDNTDNTSED